MRDKNLRLPFIWSILPSFLFYYRHCYSIAATFILLQQRARVVDADRRHLHLRQLSPNCLLGSTVQGNYVSAAQRISRSQWKPMCDCTSQLSDRAIGHIRPIAIESSKWNAVSPKESKPIGMLQFLVQGTWASDAECSCTCEVQINCNAIWLRACSSKLGCTLLPRGITVRSVCGCKGIHETGTQCWPSRWPLMWHYLGTKWDHLPEAVRRITVLHHHHQPAADFLGQLSLPSF